MSAFLTLVRRDHYAKHYSPALTEGQRSRLRSGTPFKPDLFDKDTLTGIIGEFEGASASASHINNSNFVKGLFTGKRKWDSAQGPSGAAAATTASTSPLANPEASTSSLVTQPKGGGNKYRGKKGKGRGGQRGRGAAASRGSGKGGQNFGK